MEYNKLECAVLEEIVTEVNQEQLEELSDMQLVLVGGGIGDIVAA